MRFSRFKAKGVSKWPGTWRVGLSAAGKRVVLVCCPVCGGDVRIHFGNVDRSGIVMVPVHCPGPMGLCSFVDYIMQLEDWFGAADS